LFSDYSEKNNSDIFAIEMAMGIKSFDKYNFDDESRQKIDSTKKMTARCEDEKTNEKLII